MMKYILALTLLLTGCSAIPIKPTEISIGSSGKSTKSMEKAERCLITEGHELSIAKETLVDTKLKQVNHIGALKVHRRTTVFPRDNKVVVRIEYKCSSDIIDSGRPFECEYYEGGAKDVPNFIEQDRKDAETKIRACLS